VVNNIASICIKSYYMTDTVFISMPLSELQQVITNCVKAGLSENLVTQAPNVSTSKTEELLTRKEVAEQLRVSLPTLHEWTLKGKVKAYRIGGRVLYKASEVGQCLTIINTGR